MCILVPILDTVRVLYVIGFPTHALRRDTMDLPSIIAAPGSPNFFSDLLDYVRNAVPGFPIDPVIFQSILLCIMAGNKNVVLSTPEEDVSLVQNLATLVSLSAPVCPIFGF